MKHLVFALAALFALTAQSPTPPASAQDVIDRMAATNVGLTTYTAHVHVTAHPSIPLCSLNVDGTAYFKRPGNFAVVLNPASGLCASQAKNIQDLSTDIGNPLAWEKDWNVTLSPGTTDIDGKPLLELVMTKKIYSDQIKDTTVYVDPASYEIDEMVWHYTNGDAITMTQYYTTLGGFQVVARQHFAGRRHIGFTGDSTYDSYQTNVAVDDAVFRQ
jgi:hypothetical protein